MGKKKDVDVVMELCEMFLGQELGGGVGRGFTPRPQPQTGRASFQASGFPIDFQPFQGLL